MDDEGKPENLSEIAKQKAEWDEWYRPQIKQVWEDIQSSTDSFDHNMLALSSGALGVSLAFIKDIVPKENAVWLTLLMASWIAFALCIVITVISFQVSIAALKEHRDFLDKVFASRTQDFFNRKTFLRKLLTFCTYAAGSFFVAGLACTMIFVCKNVRNIHMSNDRKTRQAIETKVVASDFGKGREPMDMLPTPASVPATPAPAQTGTGNAAPAATPCQPLKN